jgi:hypothetical protein
MGAGMASAGTRAKQSPPRGKSDRLPRWLTFSLVGLLALLVYGMFVPKPQSAFDRPEAQVNQTRPPWDVSR